MFVRRSSLVALCITLAVLLGCRRHVVGLQDFTFTHEVSPQPPRVGPTTITLNVTDRSGKRVTGARVTVEGNMSHAGMAPVFAEAKETEPGRYRAVVELSMAGDWIVSAHVTLASGRQLDHQFQINGVASS